MDERFEKLDKLARDVLKLSRNTLLVNLRFLDAALSQFELVPTVKDEISTDGHFVLYGANHVLARYKSNKESPVRDYLHMVFHCVFRHMYVHSLVDKPLWNLACDIAVENCISELGLKAVDNGMDALRQSTYDDLKKKAGGLTAERLYRYFLDKQPTQQEIAMLRGAFYADNHEIWYMTDEEKSEQYGVGKSSETADTQGAGDGDGEGKRVSAAIISLSVSEAEQVWKDISERMQMDLETFSMRQGNTAGSMVQNLKEINREKYNYEAFLKKFAVMGEAMKINDDEFDYIFYTYGLKLYKKVPLVEPLEYKEVKRIKEFVIAIDTSGSVAGELVQTFIQKTYNILKSTESFFSKINLRIIQCDADIQECVKITTQDEFDEYIKNMKIHGLGGTDFRPVFEYVDGLIAAKEFQNLKGLIYFTDGYGTFPQKKPDYDTAFVFIDDEYNNPDVPPWAIKLVLQKDEI